MELLDGAAYAAVADLEPLFDLLIALVDRQGLFDIQSCRSRQLLSCRGGRGRARQLTVAKLIHDDGDLLAMLGRQDVVEQGGLAGAQIAWLGHALSAVFPSGGRKGRAAAHL